MKAQLAEAEYAITKAKTALAAAYDAHVARVDAAEAELCAAKLEHEQDLKEAHDKVVEISDQLSGLICRVGQVGLYRDRLEVGVKAFPLTEDLKVYVVATGSSHKGPYREPIRLGSDERSLSFIARTETEEFKIVLHPDHEKQARNLAACVGPEIERFEKRQERLRPQLKEALRRRDLVEQDRYRISMAIQQLKDVREDRHEVERALLHLDLAMRKKMLVQFSIRWKSKLDSAWHKITSNATKHS